MEIVLDDPTYEPRAVQRAGERAVLRFIHDPRDVPFLKLMDSGGVAVGPGALRAWGVPVVARRCPSLVLVLYLMGPFILMLHNTSHRRLFRRPWGWMNQYIPWVLGPFFGESPETYSAHAGDGP
jgi:hypothetical protein